jgi:hypothetical protein
MLRCFSLMIVEASIVDETARRRLAAHFIGGEIPGLMVDAAFIDVETTRTSR